MKSNVRELDLAVIHARIAHYEECYGVPSDRMYEAFTVGGVPHETEDFQDWCFLHETAQDAAAH